MSTLDVARQRLLKIGGALVVATACTALFGVMVFGRRKSVEIAIYAVGSLASACFFLTALLYYWEFMKSAARTHRLAVRRRIAWSKKLPVYLCIILFGVSNALVVALAGYILAMLIFLLAWQK